MRSSDRFLLVLALTSSGGAARAADANGYALERFSPAPAGAGWLVLDDLSMHGGLGGALSVSTGFSRRPLHVGEGSGRLDVVSSQAFVGVGAALTWDRLRLTLDFSSPLRIRGQGGAVDGVVYRSPSVDPESHPDSLGDARLGLDARLLGEAGGPFRLGLGAALLFPSGDREDYQTDGTYRGVFKLLLASDLAPFTLAAHLGFHVRPLDESAAPAYPRGHEVVFGFAFGPRLPLRPGTSLVIGPEVFGATATRGLFSGTTTAAEALLTARLEQGTSDSPLLRFKLGLGVGLHREFGAPEWRAVLAVDLSDHAGRSP